MKKKRKSMFLYYPLIYSKLVLYFFSFYAFLFFGLLTDAKSHFPTQKCLKIFPSTSSVSIVPPTISPK